MIILIARVVISTLRSNGGVQDAFRKNPDVIAVKFQLLRNFSSTLYLSLITNVIFNEMKFITSIVIN